MAEYEVIRIKEDLFKSISKLAESTHRTKAGMVREMFEWYLRSIPVTGKVEDSRVVWGTDTGRE